MRAVQWAFVTISGEFPQTSEISANLGGPERCDFQMRAKNNLCIDLSGVVD
jgi:hypothetical protein